MTYEDLLAALKTFFSDTNRSPAETKEHLLDLIAEAEMLVDSIED
jgi:hypothetical protein